MNTASRFRLRLFGSPSLDGRDGAPLTGRAAQRHRLALLALLTTAPAHRLGREKLIAYLWPESDTERGRNLLNVATYVLRTALGEDALNTAGEDLRLNGEVIRSDVGDFETALSQGNHAAAVALYRGPLLDGFFLADAAEFEQWADRERERLAVAYRGALEALALAAEAAGDAPQAVTWWKARAAHDPCDSRIAHRVMQALDASGNRAGALQHGGIHRRLLEQEFGVGLPPEVAALMERLRREPPVASPAARISTGRTSAPGDPVPHDAAPAHLPAAAAERTETTRPHRAHWRVAAALLASVLVVGAAWTVWPRDAAVERSIAVLPFDNLSAAADDAHFSDGLTEEIITRLSGVAGLKVISRTSAMYFKGSEKSLRQIADELDVAHVLTGSVRQNDGRVRISAQLVDARTDAQLWAENYEYELRDMFRVQEAIASEVVGALEVELEPLARGRMAKQGTPDPEAYLLYRRGRSAWRTRTREGHEQAIQFYRRAIERDSSYADAYAGLADAYLTGYQLNASSIPEAETYSRIKWAAERALALDDGSADAHTSFAISLWWQRNWPGAERELRRAIELRPGHVTARAWYSLLLAGMGRSDEARRQIQRATELDPLAPLVRDNHGWVCYLARDYDCAIEQYRAAIEINWASSYVGLGLAYVQKDMPDEAIWVVRKAIELTAERPDFLADLAYVQAIAGRRSEARETLRRAKLQPREGFKFARAHIALGETDSAFAWLDRSSWQWPHRAARIDPALDPIRNDARFARLVARVDREMGIRP